VELEPIGRLRIVVRLLNSTPLGLYILGGKDQMHPSMDLPWISVELHSAKPLEVDMIIFGFQKRVHLLLVDTR
jgi:hypothetical protein